MMTRINLLPWREARRKEQDKQLLSIGIFAWMLMGLVVFYAHYHMTGLIEVQNGRNKYLQDEIVKLNAILEEIKDIKRRRRELIERMKVIYKLQADRTKMVNMMDELVRALPEGVYYVSLIQKGNRIQLKGVAQSNARVAALMRNFEASKWFEQPDLRAIDVKQDKELGIRVSRFTMSVIQRSQAKQGLNTGTPPLGARSGVR